MRSRQGDKECDSCQGAIRTNRGLVLIIPVETKETRNRPC